MTATAESTASSARRPRKASVAPTSIRTKYLGRKSGDEDVDHPPFQPRLPRINLLPASVPEAFAVCRIRRILCAVGLLMALAFAAVWYLQANQIAEAQARLGQAQAQNAAVTARVEALAPIKQMYEQITNEQSLVATTLASEPKAALVIGRLVGAGSSAAGGRTPVEFTSIAVEYRGVPEPGADLNPCPSPDPFATDITIGCVTFSGTAGTRDQVSAMLNAMAADVLFVGPYVNNSTVTEATADGPGGVMFTGSAGISVDALMTALTDEEVDAIIHPPAPEGAGTDVTTGAGQ